MRNLARILASAGFPISGSDAAITPWLRAELAALGMSIQVGHSAEHVPPGCELLIYSPAVSSANSERLAAARRNIAQMSYVEVLAQLMTPRLGISIAGTHGKSSTTAMVGQILRAAGEDPLVLLGADHVVQQPMPGSNCFPRYCVVESCEYREHFLTLSPQVICLTSIEPDHLDCFPSLSDAVAAYQRFLGRLVATADGQSQLICHRDDPQVAALADQIRHAAPHVRITSFGLGTSADWTAELLDPSGSSFRLRCQDRDVGTVQWTQFGQHQALNAVGAAATAAALGVSAEAIRRGLNEFQGLRRRLELFPHSGGVRVFDDYAHHPTAIRLVLQTLRKRYGSRTRLWCAFQPHQVSRTRGLLEEFAQSLTWADQAFVLPIFGARETDAADFVEVAQQLTLRARQLGGQVEFLPQVDDLAALLTTVPAGDVFITLGAGDIDRIHHERPGSVPRNHQV